jgi:ABC-2 type transport system ATP-binding protein
MQASHPNRILLEISNLTKTYSGSDRPAVSNVSFCVEAGEILGFVGLNGAGKTTTIRVATGLNKPSAGRVSIAGFDIVLDKVKASRNLGLVPEFPNFDPGARALSLLRYFSGFHGQSGQQANDRCSDLLELVGLEEARELRFRSLSQGMKKRLALAVAMLGDPDVLLLDEVLNGLDPKGIVLVRDLMLRWRKEGKAVLLSSHLLNETQHVADRVAIINDGRLVKILSRSEMANDRTGVLRISILDLDSSAMEYLATTGEASRDGSTVWVSNPTAEAEEINSELMKRGYHVRSISFESSGLEGLFLGLIAEPKSEASEDARGE